MESNNSEKKSAANPSPPSSNNRRDFLKKSAAAGIASLLIPAVNLAKETVAPNPSGKKFVDKNPDSATVTF
ncbi:MAG: twin-arginine translocation signal domain-containing protein [Bacteroidetes bacterium]|nr:twin-arginine translocation signal domain-containing protein [Bacteroidota bacterium]